MSTVRLANLFVEDEKPWVLAKQSPQNPRLLTMLNLVFETLRTTAIIMQPVVPNLSTLVLGIHIKFDKYMYAPFGLEF